MNKSDIDKKRVNYNKGQGTGKMRVNHVTNISWFSQIYYKIKFVIKSNKWLVIIPNPWLVIKPNKWLVIKPNPWLVIKPNKWLVIKPNPWSVKNQIRGQL